MNYDSDENFYEEDEEEDEEEDYCIPVSWFAGIASLMFSYLEDLKEEEE